LNTEEWVEVAGNNDATVNGFSRTVRRLAGAEAGRRRCTPRVDAMNEALIRKPAAEADLSGLLNL